MAPDLENPSADLRIEIVRSPADVLRLVVGGVVLLAVLIVEWLWGETLVSFTGDLLQGLGAWPAWIPTLIIAGTRVLALVVLVGAFAVALRSGGGRMLGTTALGAAAGAAIALLLEPFDTASGTTTVDLNQWLGPLTAEGFPTAIALAAVAGAVTAAEPWVARRGRRLAWALVLILAVDHFLATPASFDTLRAVLAGWVAGAATLVLLGGPSRRPSLATVSAGLAGVGVDLADLHQASVDARGSTPYFGETVDGQKLFVKALGDDQRSADLLFRLYRMARRRDLGDERPFSSLRRTVEHEAMVALAARELGVRTPRLVAFATAEPNSFVLAYEAVEGRSLDRVDEAEVPDAVLNAIWSQVVLMRHHRIAHRDMRLANIFLAADGAVWMIDFGFSELAASDLLLANDIAELVSSSSLKVGPERAVAAARTALTPDELRPALDRLRLWALSGATRTGLKASPGLLDDIQRRLSAAAAKAA